MRHALRRHLLRICGFITFGAMTVGGQVPTVRLSYEGNPAGPLSGSSTGLLLTLDTDKPLANGRLVLQAPKELGLVLRGRSVPNAVADTAAKTDDQPRAQLSIPIRAASGIQSFLIDVHWVGDARRKAQVKLIAQAIADVLTSAPDTSRAGYGGEATPGPSVARALAQAAIPIDITRSIAIPPYFVLGLLGVMTGWVLRVVLAAQAKIPNPDMRLVDKDDGPITKFIKAHYYLCDFLIASTLGALVLLALVTDGKPPEKVDSGIAAYLLGVALGGLANSELFLRLQKK